MRSRFDVLTIEAIDPNSPYSKGFYNLTGTRVELIDESRFEHPLGHQGFVYATVRPVEGEHKGEVMFVNGIRFKENTNGS